MTQEPLRRLYLLYHELRAGGSEYSYVIDSGAVRAACGPVCAMRAAENGEALWPEVTFDDGHVSNFELAAPILQARGLTAQFFITVGWTGTKAGYMGWEELRSLHEAGHPIGAHGWTHTLLTHCSEESCRRSWARRGGLWKTSWGHALRRCRCPAGDTTGGCWRRARRRGIRRFILPCRGQSAAVGSYGWPAEYPRRCAAGVDGEAA